MSTDENRSTVTLMMLELSGTALLLVVIVLCAYFRRCFSKKSLNGSTVLITNGTSDLSLSLANHLSFVHKCKIILVKEPSPNNNSDIHQLNIHQPTANISTFECNILISTQLEQLSKAIDKLFDGIDLIIDNGLSVHTVHQSSNEFITSISNSLLATINLLMFFVPKMKYSLGGHVVSIQSASSDMPIPLFDPCGEIQRLVRLLTTNNTGASIESVPVQLTTVLFNRNDGREGSASNTNSKMDVTNVVEQIIAGIQRNRSLIQIKESTSLMQTILNFFPKII